MSSERNKNIRNVAIIIVLAVIVWKVPGGGTAAATLRYLLSIAFLAGMFFFGYRLYMERRETILSLEERQRALLYGALGVALFAIVATGRMWEARPFGPLLWLALLGAAGWALYSVWRAYRTY